MFLFNFSIWMRWYFSFCRMITEPPTVAAQNEFQTHIHRMINVLTTIELNEPTKHNNFPLISFIHKQKSHNHSPSHTKVLLSSKSAYYINHTLTSTAINKTTKLHPQCLFRIRKPKTEIWKQNKKTGKQLRKNGETASSAKPQNFSGRYNW